MSPCTWLAAKRGRAVFISVTEIFGDGALGSDDSRIAWPNRERPGIEGARFDRAYACRQIGSTGNSRSSFASSPRRGVITTRFTFHDLRAYYVMQYKERRGEVPDLHASPTRTARVYERSRVSRRDALSRRRIPTVGILGAIKTKGLAPHDANPLIWLVGPE